jgi:predicted NBD/HSP70 family sugar kinase
MNGQDSLRVIRRAHEDQVLDQISRHGPLSRQDLVRRTGLSRTTLLALVTGLIDRGALVQVRVAGGRTGRGRPLHHIALNPQGGLWVAIEVGHARVRVAFANAAHEVIGRGEAALALGASRAVKTRAADRLVERVRSENDITVGALRGIALAVVGPAPDSRGSGSGPVDRAAASLARHLERTYGAPVLVDNNTRLAAYAEATWGSATGLSNVLYLRLSDGVSSGIIAGGTLLRGAHGLAGEIGHVGVDPAGPPCHCGRRGCLEGMLGITGLLSAAADAGLRVADSAELLARADSDPVLRRIIGRAVAGLVRLLIPMIMLLDPDAIVVGGPLSRLESLVVQPIRAAARDSAFRAVEVLPAALDTYEAPLGGLALMLRASQPSAAGVVYDAVRGAP